MKLTALLLGRALEPKEIRKSTEEQDRAVTQLKQLEKKRREIRDSLETAIKRIVEG